MNRRSFLGLTALGALGALTASSGFGKWAWAQTPEQKSLRRVAINLGLTYIPVNNAPLYTVPQAMGFWAEEGLDVEVQMANGVGSALQQLIAGQVVGSLGGTPPAMSLIEQGAPIKVVCNCHSRNVYYPVALASSPIKTIADMKGAKVGVTSPSSSNVYFIKGLIGQHGLDPDKDIELVGVGAGPAALQALISGQIDVLQLYDASYDQIEQMGYPLRRFNDDPEFNKLAFIFGMATRQEIIDNDRPLLTGIMRGMTKGIIYCQAHPEEAVRMHWGVYPLGKPQGVSDEEAMNIDLPVLLSGLKNHQWAYEGKFGYAKPEEVAAVRDTLYAYKAISEKLPIDRYYDPSFVEEINNFDHEALIARQAPE